MIIIEKQLKHADNEGITPFSRQGYFQRTGKRVGPVHLVEAQAAVRNALERELVSDELEQRGFRFGSLQPGEQIG